MMRTIVLDETLFDTRADVHAFLKQALDFPSYYGANLSALSDCLGDICEDTCIIVRHVDDARGSVSTGTSKRGGVDSDIPEGWFEHLIAVMRRAADENSALRVVVRGTDPRTSASYQATPST